ncbi:Potassium-transporting ATPase B chain [Turneriella parva DSM 21527]|uniref:Potassium-transporting ATPase ATP-binding subunit n=1 Tax=Turneriella parva (strain ATCC BAA-1111 / DSM 21527 / NCTC 11395 / H) TaxID=869212 RepID=I4B151_TURPD|nr:potassium-transporting ATPase subunit KdpB [Turneriella parva]AFM11008.1 Potassium-transporting ATPase B chain [Turneriella parva DSM 21527]
MVARIQKNKKGIFTGQVIQSALWSALRKFHPAVQMKNPVIFMVTVGALFCTGLLLRDMLQGRSSGFTAQITLWLYFTTFFANFAEAIAEGRGKARADALRQAKTHTMARVLVNGAEQKIPAGELTRGMVVVCEAGDQVPGDGEVISGIASVDESAITGESAPVIRESGGDRSAVTGGTRVISDRIEIRITAEPGHSFLDKMISLIEGAIRAKTPNEIALTILLSILSIVFLLAVVAILPYARFSEAQGGIAGASEATSIPLLIALLVCLIPTTIGGLLSAIGISGMGRLMRANVLATSGRAIEAAGDIDVLLLDKTGTITLGNRMASEFIPATGVDVWRLADAAQLASLADETPEGRSVVVLAKEKFNLRGRELLAQHGNFVPFSAVTRLSGIDIPMTEANPERIIRKGAAEAVRALVLSRGGVYPVEIGRTVEDISRRGGTPLVVAENKQVLGVIHLKDTVKRGLQERFADLRKMGIRTIMITGDNALTAAAIAAEAGVDDFIAQATPEAKLRRIRDEQAKGHLVAMIGDGTNDAPALAQADVGVAMNSGTQVAREAGNMLDLDSNPTKLIEIVEIGKQLLITRGALTTFSIANDVSKYFAILPALFGGLYASTKFIPSGVEGLSTGAATSLWKPETADGLITSTSAAGPLAALNIMGLQSPESAILSAVIFNALIIIALVPLALKGVKYRAEGADRVVLKNLLVYGLGGLITPFLGIKLIDMAITAMHWV